MSPMCSHFLNIFPAGIVGTDGKKNHHVSALMNQLKVFLCKGKSPPAISEMGESQKYSTVEVGVTSGAHVIQSPCLNRATWSFLPGLCPAIT